MSSAKLTIIGFYNYMQSLDKDLFEHLLLPDGIDKETLVSNIMLRGGEFEVIYSDPFFMCESIKTFSKKWQRTFEKWVNALSISYNPLENYDRMEEWTDTNSSTGNVNGTTTDHSAGTGSNITENKKSAYDSESYSDYDKSESNLNNTNDTTTTLNTDNSTSANGNHVGRIHGNIGVLTSQAMLESELQLAEWNLYEHITDLFLSEYVIPIYS